MITAEQHIAIAGPLGGIEGLDEQVAIAVAIDIAEVDQAVAEVVGVGGAIERETAGEVAQVLVEVLVAAQIDVGNPT